ncbi:MAG: CDP-archaeol synthase [Candidatus Woesearchaeota archaeon]
MELGTLALKSLYLLLPGLIANMAPVFASKYNILDIPVDLGRKWKGKPIFGAHKTYRGFLFGIIYAVVIVYIQKILFLDFAAFRHISLIDYSSTNVLLLGFLLGFGTLFGDLTESFFKRRRGIGSGQPWIPWDQLDLVIGALIFLAIIYIPPISVVAFLIITVPILHVASKHIGYYLGISEKKW